MKKNNWKQNNPKEQLVALLSSIEGDLSNIHEGVVRNFRTSHERIMQNLQDVKDILGKYMPDSDWKAGGVPLDDIYNACDAKEYEKAIDLIFSSFDYLMRAGRFDLCDYALRVVDLDKLDSTLSTGILCATVAGRKQLKERDYYMDRVRKQLSKTVSPKELNDLLEGLK